MTSHILFAELLCARLCHDMAGAVGATAAGAELLEDGLDAEMARMVAASAAGAAARLKFFRAALGPAGSEQPAAAIRDLAAAYLRAAETGGGRLDLRWTCDRPRLDGDVTRLALNLVLVARDSLPRGGAISVDIAAGVAVAFQGEGGGLSDELTATLLSGDDPSNPRTAQAWFTRRLANKIGTTIHFERLGDGGRITT
ncbi:MAG: histidine phosphotransferase family protein [Phaeospirillum sp.]|nr:histidine phosphotransferase family protein [Phaeospirillum sp.]